MRAGARAKRAAPFRSRKRERGKTMTHDNTDVVRAFVDAINGHSSPALSNLMTEDHTFVDSSGKAVAGREKIVAGWSEYFRMFPDYTIQVGTILREGEVVAVFGSAAGTYNGRRGLLSENKIEMPVAWRAIVQDGKVKLWQVYADWTDGARIINEDEAAE